MICVYCLSYVPALLTLDIPGYTGLNPLLIVFLILVAQSSDVLLYIWGKLVALPTNWTYREDSLMIKTHLALLAQNGQGVPGVTNANANAFASATPIDAPMEA